jgi:hypothetical protein
MTENKNRKGFAGLDDLVSDVSKDLENTRQVAEKQATKSTSQPREPVKNVSVGQENTTSQQPISVSQIPTETGSSSAGKKIIFAIVIGVILIAIFNSINKESGPGKEEKPPVGSHNTLTNDQLRYCVSEGIRLDAMKPIINPYSQYEVTYFNITVQDYNSRCSSFRYRRNALDSVRKEVEAYRFAIESEGRNRILTMR